MLLNNADHSFLQTFKLCRILTHTLSRKGLERRRSRLFWLVFAWRNWRKLRNDL